MRRISADRAVYWLVLLLMAISFSGIPALRYGFYFAPLATFALWAVVPGHRLHVSRPVLPFLLVVLLGVVSLAWQQDIDVFKRTVFIFVYSSLFVMFDFSRLRLDTRRLSLLFVILFLWAVAIGATKHTGASFSLLNSTSPYESTLAFPLGLCALALLIEKRWAWFSILSILSLLALKRIVLLGLVIAILVWLLPRRIRGVLLNPVVLTILAGVAIVASIALAKGQFDGFIWEHFDKAPNDFTKGRQALWALSLKSADFHWDDYLFWGNGLGSSISTLKEALHVERILVHNDLLSLVLDVGILFTALFVLLVVSVQTQEQRLFAAFLLLLLLTDNVLIYQHVMVPYLLFQHHLMARRGKIRRKEA